MSVVWCFLYCSGLLQCHPLARWGFRRRPISMSDPLTDQVFIALGPDDHARWHHRVLLARGPAQVESWWRHMVATPPALVLSLSDLEVGVANLAMVYNLHDQQTIWGGWIHSQDQVRLVAVVAPSLPAAEELLLSQVEQGERLACVVDPAPWLALVAHCRGVAEGEAPPDEDLRPRAVLAT